MSIDRFQELDRFKKEFFGLEHSLNENRKQLSIIEKKIEAAKKNCNNSPDAKQEMAIKTRYFDKLQCSINNQEYIQKVLSEIGKVYGLKNGEMVTSFHFADMLTWRDAGTTDVPSLYLACPYCSKQHPVIVEFTQIKHNPSGHEWEKQAFLMCPTTHMIYELGGYNSRYN